MGSLIRREPLENTGFDRHALIQAVKPLKVRQVHIVHSHLAPLRLERKGKTAKITHVDLVWAAIEFVKGAILPRCQTHCGHGHLAVLGLFVALALGKAKYVSRERTVLRKGVVRFQILKRPSNHLRGYGYVPA
ncbi:MAG: hypothetical protein AAGG57_20545 [Pseudomonadota bacterium]